MPGRSEPSRLRRSLLAALLVSWTSLAEASPLVVIDPGHGGSKKPGAKNDAGKTEASIVLAISKLLRGYLEKAGVRVMLTREDDVDRPLRRRPAVANKVDADAFVSIHANWSVVSARRGSESYILSADASDADAAALLHLEEAEDVGEEEVTDLDGEAGDIDFIVADLERAAAHESSARLARYIQDTLGDVDPLAPSRGLRQAPFLVLRRSKVPAVLVELGYLSNAGQGRALAERSTQRQAARALARAIVRYLKEK